MLPRRRDLLKSDKNSSTSSTSTSRREANESRGGKRKLADEDGSDYLRRKHNFIKSTIRVDYQPDVCKDYKETGFCGFGDSCKFLHDRSDYKHGWQIEQDWVKSQLKKKDEDKTANNDAKGETKEGNESEPRVCPICEGSFKDPIITKCKHHFCGLCADKECSDKCFVCKKPTSGIFKVFKITSTPKESDEKLPHKSETITEDKNRSPPDDQNTAE